MNEQLDQDFNSRKMHRPHYLYLITRADGGYSTVLGAKNHYTRFFIPHVGVTTPALVRISTVSSTPNISSPMIPTSSYRFNPEGGNPRRIRRRSALAWPDCRGRSPRLSRAARYRLLSQRRSGAGGWRELAHPDRMPRRSRELYKNYIEWLLDYTLSDDELDTAFGVKDNHNMANAERFEAQHHEQ